MSCKSIVLVFALASLSACVSSGGDEGTTTTQPTSSDPVDNQQPTSSETVLPTYQPLLGGSGTSISQLRGAVVTAKTGDAQLRRVTGRLRHSAGKLVIDDGIYKLADENGFNASGEAENESVTLRLVNPNGRYRHASLYSTSYTVGADTYTAVGAIGIATLDEDMPSQGSARYSGDAVYAFTSNTGSGFGGVGAYTATVNFADAEVNSNVDVTSAVNVFTRVPVNDPDFDQIEMNNLRISGSTYSGSSMRTLKNGTAVAITGANTSGEVQGQFYGLASTSSGTAIPDEIAGEALLEGDGGNVILSFIAD